MDHDNTAAKAKASSPKKRILWNVFYIFLTICIMVVICLLDPNARNIPHLLTTLKPMWIGAALFGMVLFWLLEGETLHYMTKFIHRGFGRLKSFKTAMIGVYYSALTPFSSGGQPMQVMHMKRDGVPVGRSTSMFCVKFIVFEFVVCTFFIVGLAVDGLDFFTGRTQVFYLTCLGFALNAFLAALALAAIFSKHKLQVLAARLVVWLHKIHIGRFYLIKNPQRTLDSLNNTLNEFASSAGLLRGNKRVLIGSFLLMAGQMLIQYSITYCIYRAFDLSGVSYWNIIFMQAFLFLTVSFVPLPGAAGASEGGFYLFFALIFPGTIMPLAMLLWRFATYYANILFGSFFVMYDGMRGALGVSSAKSRGVPVQPDKEA